MLKIKICGMRDAANVREVAALDPDFMGFIYYPKSPRHIAAMSVDTVASLPESVIPTLVTVNMVETDIMRLIKLYAFKAVQLHGNESPELCKHLRANGLTVFKSATINNESSISAIRQYVGAVDYMLFDTPSIHHGGSGRKFDWSLLSEYNIPIPFFLSGGIGPEDVSDLLSINHPQLAGIDVNSRFEISPANKDPQLLSKFLLQLKHNYEQTVKTH